MKVPKTIIKSVCYKLGLIPHPLHPVRSALGNSFLSEVRLAVVFLC
jgi:hypothetical protein